MSPFSYECIDMFEWMFRVGVFCYWEYLGGLYNYKKEASLYFRAHAHTKSIHTELQSSFVSHLLISHSLWQLECPTDNKEKFPNLLEYILNYETHNKYELLE